MKQWYVRLAVGAAVSATLSACGADDAQTAQTVETVTVTVTPTSEVPSRQTAETPPTSASTSPATTSGASPSSPGSVPTERVGQPLSLRDAHSFYPDGEWEEGLYEVADRSDVRAMGTAVSICGQASNSPYLEFRLANRFDTLSMKVAQANSAQSSDQTLIVVIEGNDEQIEIRQVPFNEVVSIDNLSIDGVNALRVRLFLDEEDEDCRSGSTGTTAVIEQLVVA